MRVTLSVNGERYDLDVSPVARLADVLRDDLGLVGACGACAVLVDGRSVNSCLLYAAAAEGHELETIEGISRDGLTPLQEAFVASDAVQCGFCTSGQIVSATALLRTNPAPGSDEVRRAMSGNICRCGCYVKIERAILTFAGGDA